MNRLKLLQSSIGVVTGLRMDIVEHHPHDQLTVRCLLHLGSGCQALTYVWRFVFYMMGRSMSR